MTCCASFDVNPHITLTLTLILGWHSQRAMSARPDAPPAPDFVNRLLGANFAAMARMGDLVLKPFLQVRCRLFGCCTARWP